MSQRQPTIQIENEIIAHDEIAEIIDLNTSVNSADIRNESPKKAIRLVNGAIVPLPMRKFADVLEFIIQNEY